MEANRVVWVTNFAGHDLEPAREFGTLKYVTRGFIDFEKLRHLQINIVTTLAASKPDDHLLLSGTNLISALCVMIMFQLHKKVNIITHDRSNDSYRTLQFTSDTVDDVLKLIGEPNATA